MGRYWLLYGVFDVVVLDDTGTDHAGDDEEAAAAATVLLVVVVVVVAEAAPDLTPGGA